MSDTIFQNGAVWLRADFPLQRTSVDIMEGGREAFDKRKEIYQSWNS
jgi:hypothetical protein